MYDLLQRKKRAFVILSVLCMLAVALGMMLLALPQRVSASEEESHGDHSGWTQITASTRTLSTGNYYLADDITLQQVHKHGDVTFTEFSASLLSGDVLPTGSYYLSGDTERTRAIVIEEEVTFCLNGSRLYGDGVSQMFLVQDGGSLTICDCQSGNEAYKHYYTVAENGLYEFSDAETADYIAGGVISNANGAVYVKAGGSFVLESGTIAGNRVSANGGAGIYASQAEIEIAGGAVVGNTALNTSSNGIGVYAFKCTFTMSGGKIEGNTGAQWGGGVYLSSSSFVMTGGSIKDNSAKFGGGVYLVENVNYPEDAVFHMTGGTIEGNEATEQGGGVYLRSGSMQIGGTPVIRGNTLNGAANDTDGRIGLTMTEKLLEGAQIGLGAFDAVENVVTGYSDYNEEDPNKFFFANTVGDSVVLEEGNLIIVQTYVIHYYLNGTLLGTQTAFCDGDTLMTFEELQGTLTEGNSFYGWATAPGSQTVSYGDGQTLSAALAEAGGSIDLYAVVSASGSSLEEQLDRVNEELDGAIEALEGQEGELLGTALKNAIDAINKAYAAADEAIRSEMAEENASLSARIASLSASIRSAREALQDAIDQVAQDLETARSELQAAIDATALTSSLNEAKNTLQSAVDQVAADLVTAKAELQAAIDANEKDIEEKLAALDAAYKAADALLASDIAGLEGSVGELNEADEALKAALDALDEAYKAADEAILEAVEELRAENAAQDAELERQDAELERQDGELNTLSVVLYISLAVAVVALGVGTAGLVFGLKAKKKD